MPVLQATYSFELYPGVDCFVTKGEYGRQFSPTGAAFGWAVAKVAWPL
jgi:hypothetical protein